MSRRVLVAPGPLKGIEHAFAPVLRDAGYAVEYPAREGFSASVICVSAENPSRAGYSTV